MKTANPKENQVSKEIDLFCQQSKLNTVQESTKEIFPSAVIFRLDGKLTPKILVSSLLEAFKEKDFPQKHLLATTQNGLFKLYNIGKGVAIPVHKEIEVSSFLKALNIFAKNSRKYKMLKIEVCKDSLFQNGRNASVQIKGLAPTVDAREALSEFGHIISMEETLDGWTVVYKDVKWQLILQSYIHSPKKFGQWFPLYRGSTIMIRFTSSSRCSNCCILGHHKSNCSNKIVDMKLKYDQHGSKAETNTPLKLSPPIKVESPPKHKQGTDARHQLAPLTKGIDYVNSSQVKTNTLPKSEVEIHSKEEEKTPKKDKKRKKKREKTLQIS